MSTLGKYTKITDLIGEGEAKDYDDEPNYMT